MTENDYDPMIAMDSNRVNNMAAADQSIYDMMAYNRMLYNNRGGGAGQYGGGSAAGFAQRSGNMGVGNTAAGGGNSNGQAAATSAAGGGGDLDNASTRQIANGIGVSGYGAGMGGGYGGYGGGFGGGNAGLERFGGGSGYGGGGVPINVLGSGYGAVCEDSGLNPSLVLATLVGSVVAFAVLFRQLTVSRRRRKRRRDFPEDGGVDGEWVYEGETSGFLGETFEWVADLAWKGKLTYVIILVH